MVKISFNNGENQNQFQDLTWTFNATVNEWEVQITSILLLWKFCSIRGDVYM
ncbi:hypothetical protein KHA95_11575 [Bacillus sp. FJAT-50079]|nr:hypothetical protein [Bacillus sp. FJAT-50079]